MCVVPSMAKLMGELIELYSLLLLVCMACVADPSRGETLQWLMDVAVSGRAEDESYLELGRWLGEMGRG